MQFFNLSSFDSILYNYDSGLVTNFIERYRHNHQGSFVDLVQQHTYSAIQSSKVWVISCLPFETYVQYSPVMCPIWHIIKAVYLTNCALLKCASQHVSHLMQVSVLCTVPTGIGLVMYIVILKEVKLGTTKMVTFHHLNPSPYCISPHVCLQTVVLSTRWY